MFYSQSASTCPFATFSPVGWLASDCTQKSSPAGQMICCSHVQPARIRDLKGACVCTTGLVNHSLLLPWLEITPFLSYIVPWMKKKGPSVTRSISQNNFKLFLQLCRKQWTEFRAQMWCRVMHLFYRTQKRLLIICALYAYICCLPLHCNTTHSGKGKRPFWLCSS